jgi:membrane protein
MPARPTTPPRPEPDGGRAAGARVPRLDTLRDYARRLAGGFAADNGFFLAGGVAFSLLLALVPFALLLVVGLSFALGRDPAQAMETVIDLTQHFLPPDAFEAGAVLRTMVEDVFRTRGAVGLGALLGFLWTSTRLFGSLRAVLAIVLDRGDRGIVAGKLFDAGAALVTAVLVVLWAVVSSYVALVGDRGASLLAGLGVRVDTIGALGYAVGRLTSFALLALTFFAAYRGLPQRRPGARAALVAAASAAVGFELARHLFGVLLGVAPPASVYTGTIAVIVSVVFWMYYGAVLFVLGAEVVQAHELRAAELAALAQVPDPRRSP